MSFPTETDELRLSFAGWRYAQVNQAMQPARRVKAAPELIRSKDRCWDISHKRAEAVAILVRECGYGVSEVAKYLGRDQANVSTMLSRLSARPTERK